MVLSASPHPDLQILRTKLNDILRSISTFGPGASRPPVIDASVEVSGESTDDITTQQDALPGLRALRDAVQRDLDVLEKFLADSNCASLPALSTNAPYLISVWNEVLLATPPVTAIWATFSQSGKAVVPRRKGHSKEDGVKVDVVADGGRSWVRVNTIKNSRILAEFREIDSYQTDSEGEGDDDPSLQGRPSLAQSELDNSVLRMARSLVAAAKENTIPGNPSIPSITMQITRLDTSPSNPKEHDARIAGTLDIIKGMGIEVRLGERSDSVLSSSFQPKPVEVQKLEPSIRLNLDLSILVALVSDLTHSPLPVSVEDADARFTPSELYLEWKRARLESTAKNGGPTEAIDLESLARPSKALSNQALQEMVKGLFQEIHDRLSPLQETGSSGGTSPTFPPVEFWTTPEARDRCLKIVSKIGGPNEKRRAQALFHPFTSPTLSLSEAEEVFWHGSRYPCGFIPLLPIRLLPSSEPSIGQRIPNTTLNGHQHVCPLSLFFGALAHTCRAILEQEIIPDPRTLRSSPSPNPSINTGNLKNIPNHTADENDDEEIQRATVTKANPRLTAHTVQSMLWGAVNGWTTLTANRTSVKAMLREIKGARFGARWDSPRPATLGSNEGDGEGKDVEERAEIAALWVVDPRSLAEGMRSDFGMS